MFSEAVFGLTSSSAGTLEFPSSVPFIPSINMASQADLIACVRSSSVISLSPLPPVASEGDDPVLLPIAMPFVIPFTSSSIPFASSRVKSSRSSSSFRSSSSLVIGNLGPEPGVEIGGASTRVLFRGRLPVVVRTFVVFDGGQEGTDFSGRSNSPKTSRRRG